MSLYNMWRYSSLSWISFLLLLIIAPASANPLLFEFKLASTGSGGDGLYKFDAVVDDHVNIPCVSNSLYVGIRGESDRVILNNFVNPKRFSCDNGKESAKEWAEKYVNANGGFNKWNTVSNAMIAHWTGVCVSYYNNMIEQSGDLGCTGMAPSDISCDISEGNIMLQHGYISNGDVDGNSVEKTVSLNCSGKVDARIYAGPSFNEYSGKILLISDGSLSSTIKINGTEATNKGVTVNFLNGTNTLTVSSNLHGNGKISAGSYSGNGVLVVEPQ